MMVPGSVEGVFVNVGFTPSFEGSTSNQDTRPDSRQNLYFGEDGER